MTMDKEKIIRYAKEISKKIDEFNLAKKLSDTQIRKYLDVLKDPNLEIYEEYRIYLEYQMRELKNDEMKKLILEKTDALKDGDWKEKIAYLFGILWRLRRIESKKKSGGENE